MIEKPAVFDIPKSELLTWTEPCLRRVLWTRDSRFDTIYDSKFNFCGQASLYKAIIDINRVKPNFVGVDDFFYCILKLLVKTKFDVFIIFFTIF